MLLVAGGISQAHRNAAFF